MKLRPVEAKLFHSDTHDEVDSRSEVRNFKWGNFEHNSYNIRGKAASFHGKGVRRATFTQSVINCLGFFFRYVRKDKKLWLWEVALTDGQQTQTKLWLKFSRGKNT
jgi:hypothetical protein